MIVTNSESLPASSGMAAADSWVALVYHDVQPLAARSGGGPDHFTVPLASFECMLDAIAEARHAGCSLATAITQPGRRRVAITFDDGTLGQYDYAFPALVARGMTATFYVTIDWIGTPGFMSWDQLRDLVASGMSVQSHTATHPFLSELGADELRAELIASKAALDTELGQDTSEIAFPGGDAPTAKLRFLITEAGYRTAVGTRWGVNSDRQPMRGFVRRCTLRGEVTAERARRIVEADPWLKLSSTAKEATLRRIRATLGASRYARWRRRFLDSLAGSPGGRL